MVRNARLSETSRPLADWSDADWSDPARAELLQADPMQRETVGYLINLIARLLAQALKARNGGEGILPGQYPLALELLRHDGATQRELCEAVRLEQATVANTLKRMERDGLVERKPTSDNARLATNHLTAKGRALARVAVENALDVNQTALEGLDAEACAALRQTLSGIALRLESDLAKK